MLSAEVNFEDGRLEENFEVTNEKFREAMTGLFAAVATPIHDDGRFDEAGFDRLVDFLVEAGVDGICIGGATGEYPHFETAERKAVIRRAAERLPRDRALLVGIGSSSMRGTLELGEAAVAAGSRALLLPMPMFFRYQQEDLQAFAAHVSRALRAPCLLYDLPDFTNGLAPATVLALLRDEEFIVGIKDSSGQEENLTTFAAARAGSRLDAARRRRPAAVRGSAGGMGRRHFRRGRMLSRAAGRAGAKRSRRTRADETARLQARLDELIARLSVFSDAVGHPHRARGARAPDRPAAAAAHAARRQQIQDFQAWFRGWISEVLGATRSTILHEPGTLLHLSMRARSQLPTSFSREALRGGAQRDSVDRSLVNLKGSNDMRMKAALLIAPLLGLGADGATAGATVLRRAPRPCRAAPSLRRLWSIWGATTPACGTGRPLRRYRDQNRALTAPAASESRVVFMGDSITDAWPRRVDTFFAGKPYVGRGISGQTTPQMLIRFRPDVVDLKPKVVVILAGTNDIAENTGPMTNEEIQGESHVDGRDRQGQRHPRRLLEHPAGERVSHRAERRPADAFSGRWRASARSMTG